MGTDDLKLTAVVSFYEMEKSLNEAVEEAGGCPNKFDLQRMSALELMTLLAPNNVRFVYMKSKTIVRNIPANSEF